MLSNTRLLRSNDILDGEDQQVDTADFILCSVEIALGE